MGLLDFLKPSSVEEPIEETKQEETSQEETAAEETDKEDVKAEQTPELELEPDSKPEHEPEPEPKPDAEPDDAVKSLYINKILTDLRGQISDDMQRYINAILDEKLEEKSRKVLSDFDKVLANSLPNKAIQEKIAETIEKQNEIIVKQHNAAIKYEEDVLYKLKKDLIMELIGIADNIRIILQDAQNPGYNLLDAVKGLSKWVDATLENNSVHAFRESEYSPSLLNRKRQEVVERITTDKPEEDGTYVCEQPGYEWCMPYLVINSEVKLEQILKDNQAPQRFSFVIRPEEVILRKYKPAETITPPAEESNTQAEESNNQTEEINKE